MKTYSTGTLATIDGQDAILAQVDYGKICFIDLNSGNRWHDPIQVDCADEIPYSKLKEAADGEKMVIKKEKSVW